MTATQKTARFCFWTGSAFVVLAVTVGLAYYFLYRPMWATVDMAGIERLLRDPSTPIEAIRRTALQGQKTVLAGFEAVDAAILFLLFCSALAGAALFYVFAALRRVHRGSGSNAL